MAPLPCVVRRVRVVLAPLAVCRGSAGRAKVPPSRADEPVSVPPYTLGGHMADSEAVTTPSASSSSTTTRWSSRIRELLEAEGDIEVVGESGLAQEATRASPRYGRRRDPRRPAARRHRHGGVPRRALSLTPTSRRSS